MLTIVHVCKHVLGRCVCNSLNRLVVDDKEAGDLFSVDGGTISIVIGFVEGGSGISIGLIEVPCISTSIGFSGVPLGIVITPVAFIVDTAMGGNGCVSRLGMFLKASLIIRHLFCNPDGDLLLLSGEGDLMFHDSVDVVDGGIELWADLGGDLLST